MYYYYIVSLLHTPYHSSILSDPLITITADNRITTPISNNNHVNNNNNNKEDSVATDVERPVIRCGSVIYHRSLERAETADEAEVEEEVAAEVEE